MTSNLKVGTITVGENKIRLGNDIIEKIYLGDGNVVYQTKWPRWIQLNNLNMDREPENLDFYHLDHECNYVGEIKYNNTYYPVYTPEDYDSNGEYPYKYILLLTPYSDIQFQSSDIFENFFDGDTQYLMDNLDDTNAEEMWVNTVYLDTDKSTVIYDSTYPKHNKEYIIQSGD